MTLKETIKRYKKHSECIQQTLITKEEAMNVYELLKELKAYKEAEEEIDRKRKSGQWSDAVVFGMSKALLIIHGHIKEANADKGVLEKINEKQDSLRATCKAWDEAISRDGYVN